MGKFNLDYTGLWKKIKERVFSNASEKNNMNTNDEKNIGEEDIERYLVAQNDERNGYALALREIRNGRKMSHWIWYIFPQLRGLGNSYYSHFYGINGKEEARRYLENPVLRERLVEISNALLKHSGKSAPEILGSIDAVKVRSCMTLFDSIEPNGVFARVLDVFYGGKRDPRSEIEFTRV